MLLNYIIVTVKSVIKIVIVVTHAFLTIALITDFLSMRLLSVMLLSLIDFILISVLIAILSGEDPGGEEGGLWSASTKG